MNDCNFCGEVTTTGDGICIKCSIEITEDTENYKGREALIILKELMKHSNTITNQLGITCCNHCWGRADFPHEIVHEDACPYLKAKELLSD